LMFEPFLMTETLAAFLMILSLFLSHRFCPPPQRRAGGRPHAAITSGRITRAGGALASPVPISAHRVWGLCLD
jgi:hypothetical protein